MNFTIRSFSRYGPQTTDCEKSVKTRRRTYFCLVSKSNYTVATTMNASRREADRPGISSAGGGQGGGRDGARVRFEDHDSSTGRVQYPAATSHFCWRQLSLDKGAVAPLAQKPTAPFSESEHKKAITVARFYAECHLNGVDPWHADTAAEEAQSKYDSWWVNVTAQSRDGGQAEKRQKVSSEVDSSPMEASTKGGDTSCSQTRQHPPPPPLPSCLHDPNAVQSAKQAAIETLRVNGGDTQCNRFLSAMNVLLASYSHRGLDARWSPGDEENILSGTWFTLSKPTFSECLGHKRDNEYLYRLGRLSFDMFRPTPLLCSIQGCFNSIGKLQQAGLRDKPLPLRLFALRNQPSCVRRYE